MLDPPFQAPDLQPLLRPDSIAVVGASEKPGPGLQVLENLQQLGYRGKVFPVNPRYRQVGGLKCYPSLIALGQAGHRVQMAAILLNRNRVLPILAEAAQVGVQAAWAFASGFAETGPEGEILQRRLADLCRQHNILFCGPNCVGVLNPNGSAGTYSAPAPREVKKGNIGLVAQSGYLCIQIANANRGLGFSTICSAGNEAVLDSTDYLGYLLEDPGTQVLMAFIEQFRRPERLPALARRARALGKPIILIKVGRSRAARRATAAHTGALAGSDDVQEALFKKLGMIRVADLDELLETAELFSKLSRRLPGGKGIFSLTLSGGVISLLADLGEDLDLCYPSWSEEGKGRVREVLPPYAGVENPLDAWGFGLVEETYETCLQAAAAEERADLVLVSQDVPPGMPPRQAEQYAAVAQAAAGVFRDSGKPLVFLSNPSAGFDPRIRRILDQAGVPLLQGSREGLQAIRHLIDYAEFQRSREIGPAEAGVLQAAARPGSCPVAAGVSRVLSEHQAKEVLAQYGIPCTRGFLCSSEEEVLAAAREIHGPVALKVVSAQIPHRSEAGGIALNLREEEAIRRAYGRIMQNARDHHPEARIDGLLCQQMIQETVAEVMAGILMDPQFGPAVLFGLGGELVELLQDRALGIPPLDSGTAREMIRGTRAGGLLRGFRGRPSGDEEALIEALIRIGNLALDWAERLEALDINPLLVLPAGRGVVVADALLILKNSATQ